MPTLPWLWWQKLDVSPWSWKICHLFWNMVEMGALFFYPAPTHGMEVLPLCHWEYWGPSCPFPGSWYGGPNTRRGKPRRTGAVTSSPPRAQLLKWECHIERCATVPVPSTRAVAQRFCPERKSSYKTEDSEFVPKGIDFISNRAWRSSRLKALSKTIEVW